MNYPQTVKIVSLLPSATEIVALLGAEGALVGRSHECDYPPTVQSVPALTSQKTHFSDPSTSPAAIDAQVKDQLSSGQSLYTLDIERLRDLKPDVIITQDLCQVCSIDLATVRRAAADMTPPPAICSLNPETVEQVFDDILTVGKVIRREEEARNAVVQLRGRMHTAQEYVNAYDDQVGVAFLEWTDPLFVGGHWTPQLIERAGGRHDLNPTKADVASGAAMGPQMAYRKAGKSVQVTPQMLVESDPRWIVIGPCGLNLEQSRACAKELLKKDWFRRMEAVREGRIAIVDGNQFFNRPGPRLVDAFEFLVGLIQRRTELIPHSFAWESAEHVA